MSFKTMADVRRANKAAGLHFFDRDTMRFFRSRIVSGLYAGRFFVTAEAHHSWRELRYSIREADASGEVRTVFDFGPFDVLKDARHRARELAREARK